MIKVFFSYSHRDEDLRDELEIHLSSLKRQGLIETWHDRRIGAGKEIDLAIDENMESADVILLLISPYFIASNYCYDKEMMRAMERHEAGDARVIPVILHPSDWLNLPFGKLNAAPKDGKPISKFPNYHDGFLQVNEAIKNAAIELNRAETQSVENIVPVNQVTITSVDKLPRSSNLRVKRTFTDFEKDQFIKETFNYIANYFEGSLSELENRNSQITTLFTRVDTNHLISCIYHLGELASECKIWLSLESHSRREIRYSTTANIDDTSFNELLTIDDNGYVMFLKPMGMIYMGGGEKDSRYNPEGGAEYLWSIFIINLQ